MEPMTWDEVYAFCDSNRESDGFCRVCCACSGPTYSNMACDHESPKPDGIVILRGGNHGGCYFEVRED